VPVDGKIWKANYVLEAAERLAFHKGLFGYSSYSHLLMIIISVNLLVKSFRHAVDCPSNWVGLKERPSYV